MWQKEFPDDNIVFKPLLGEGEESLSESKEDSNPVAVAVGADDEDIVSINKPQNPDEHSNNLHFVHQTKWQKKTATEAWRRNLYDGCHIQDISLCPSIVLPLCQDEC